MVEEKERELREAEEEARRLAEAEALARETAAKEAALHEQTQDAFNVISDLDDALKAFQGALGLSEVCVIESIITASVVCFGCECYRLLKVDCISYPGIFNGVQGYTMLIII